MVFKHCGIYQGVLSVSAFLPDLFWEGFDKEGRFKATKLGDVSDRNWNVTIIFFAKINVYLFCLIIIGPFRLLRSSEMCHRKKAPPLAGAPLRHPWGLFASGNGKPPQPPHFNGKKWWVYHRILGPQLIGLVEGRGSLKSTWLFSTKSYTGICVLWPILGLRFNWMDLGIARLVLDSVKKGLHRLYRFVGKPMAYDIPMWFSNAFGEMLLCKKVWRSCGTSQSKDSETWVSTKCLLPGL